MGSVGGIVDNTFGTNIFGENANDKAVGRQNEATIKANQHINNAYTEQTNYLNPYNMAGATALEKLSGGNLVNPQNLQNDPGYQFRLQQGNTAINNAAAARGLGNSGAALKALTAYGQNVASDEYDKAYNREYNRLSQLTGMGNQTATNLANFAGQKGTSLSNNTLGLGNAQAAGEIGKGNQQGNLVNNIVGGVSAYFSDERVKTNIREIPKEDIEEMKSHLKAYYFNYISDEFGTGEWMGTMAQELEKSKIGKMLVVENAQGLKTIDQNKVLSMFLATMAEAA